MGSETTKVAPKVVEKESDSQFKLLSTKRKNLMAGIYASPLLSLTTTCTLSLLFHKKRDSFPQFLELDVNCGCLVLNLVTLIDNL
jgi:hypothetical protein